jgi:glycolate oxidase iron-sulfur subunit
MHTELPEDQPGDPDATEAAELIKSCVHCGFCLPACPTYQLLGDELDSPRGRIYLIKQMAEGNAPGPITREHLDKCLTCRSCETACPSGVRYGRLIDLGRRMLAQRASLPAASRLTRWALGAALSNRTIFAGLLRLGRGLRPLLPASVAASVPDAAPRGLRPPVRHGRRRIVAEGCVQPALQPDIDAAAARLLDRIGVSLVRVERSVCCGALNHHLGRDSAAIVQIKRNIDRWIPHLDAGAEAIVVTASGCGVMVKDYGQLLRGDAAYSAKAARISAAARDVSEVLTPQDVRNAVIREGSGVRVAWQAPCTLQHGQKIRGRVESLLRAADFEVLEPAESTRCCGSAGTYSILQSGISRQLRDLKLATLHALSPDVIATANIGCLAHLEKGASVPVRHWVQIMAGRIS